MRRRSCRPLTRAARRARPCLASPDDRLAWVLGDRGAGGRLGQPGRRCGARRRRRWRRRHHAGSGCAASTSPTARAARALRATATWPWPPCWSGSAAARSTSALDGAARRPAPPAGKPEQQHWAVGRCRHRGRRRAAAALARRRRPRRPGGRRAGGDGADAGAGRGRIGAWRSAPARAGRRALRRPARTLDRITPRRGDGDAGVRRRRTREEAAVAAGVLPGLAAIGAARPASAARCSRVCRSSARCRPRLTCAGSNVTRTRCVAMRGRHLAARPAAAPTRPLHGVLAARRRSCR